MKDNTHISQRKLASVLGISRSTVQVRIKKLQELNIVIREGTGRSGEWIDIG